MKKSSPSDRDSRSSSKRTPAGKRSGRGASSVLPFLAETLNSKPAPLEPLEEDREPPRKRLRWPW
jgi:hypothetical protein